MLDTNFPRCSTATDFFFYMEMRAEIFSPDKHQFKKIETDLVLLDMTFFVLLANLRHVSTNWWKVNKNLIQFSCGLLLLV